MGGGGLVGWGGGKVKRKKSRHGGLSTALRVQGRQLTPRTKSLGSTAITVGPCPVIYSTVSSNVCETHEFYKD